MIEKKTIELKTDKEITIMMPETVENIVFICDGGIGKNIMATVVIRNIKEKYPDKKLIVVGGFADIFRHNPHIHRFYRAGDTQHFHEDYIEGNRSIVLKAEPYYHPDYLHSNGRHLTELWCEMLGLPYDNPIPEIYLTDKEKAEATDFQRGQNGPVMILQNNGGLPPNENGVKKVKMFVRDLDYKVARNIIDECKDEYKIVQLRGKTQQGWKDVLAPEGNLRQALQLIYGAQKFLLIDSFAQHAAAAFGKKAVVCWGATNPKLLGYEQHTNLTREKACPTPFCDRPNSFLFDQVTNNLQWECPHGEICTRHDEAEILIALRK
jgi:hypothetical protein